MQAMSTQLMDKDNENAKLRQELSTSQRELKKAKEALKKLQIAHAAEISQLEENQMSEKH